MKRATYFQPEQLLADENLEQKRRKMFEEFSVNELEESAQPEFFLPLLQARYAQRNNLRVLELGPSCTTFVARALPGTAQYIGLDYCATCVQKQADRLAFHGLNNARGVHGSTYAIPLPDSSQDVVFTSCHDPFVKGSEEMFMQVFSEVSRVLQPDGEFIFTPWKTRSELADSRAPWHFFRLSEALVTPYPDFVSRIVALLAPTRFMCVFRKHALSGTYAPELQAEATCMLSNCLTAAGSSHTGT